MKKKILTIALCLVAIFATAVIVAPYNKKKDADLKQFLKEAGFHKVPSVNSFDIDKEKNWWFSEYGLYFLSFAEMDSLCTANNFIIGASDRYKEAIPATAVTTMQDNYEKIKRELVDYSFSDWRGGRGFAPFIYLSSNEVGWWIRGNSIDNHYEYSFLRKNLIWRVTKKGKRVLRDVYGITSQPTWSMQRVPELRTIHVVASVDKFDITGMTIQNHVLAAPPKPDPIAVIKHRKGYVILAKW